MSRYRHFDTPRYNRPSQSSDDKPYTGNDERYAEPLTHIEEHIGFEGFLVILDEFDEEAAEKINRAKETGHRVICVGTTSCRAVESAADENGHLEAKSGWTQIFIYPGYKFKVLDCLITNFHLPESTLIMLVSALAGREHVLAAYEEAVKERYRFFSFGDAMFIQ